MAAFGSPAPSRGLLILLCAGAFSGALRAAPGFKIDNVIVMAGVPTIMQAMMDIVAPKLKSGQSFLEPMQGAHIKTMGVVKPWAPPRSYGLIIRLNDQGVPIYAVHSRVDGVNHGVVAAVEMDGSLFAIAKGPDRDAGRETFFIPGRDSFKLPPRDPVLYFVERLRDEAHRFAIGSHRIRRRQQLREAGLQEIAGIGPTRKRALLHHFGTLKAIERASVTDLLQVDGISAETARRIYEFFHEGAA